LFLALKQSWLREYPEMSPEREVTPEPQLVPDLGDEREAALLRNSARGRILERTRQERDA
jgi:hypothetical protein